MELTPKLLLNDLRVVRSLRAEKLLSVMDNKSKGTMGLLFMVVRIRSSPDKGTCQATTISMEGMKTTNRTTP